MTRGALAGAQINETWDSGVRSGQLLALGGELAADLFLAPPLYRHGRPLTVSLVSRASSIVRDCARGRRRVVLDPGR